MKTNITFNIRTIRHPESGLSLTVTANDDVIYSQSDVDTDCQVETTVQLPARFCFDISGKHPDDTVVDEHGSIVKDKAFVLESIEFDRIRIESYTLPNSHVFLQTDLEKIPGTWWAHNGTAHVIIDRDDPVIWMLDHPEILEILPKNG